jgi:hypothetical protein
MQIRRRREDSPDDDLGARCAFAAKGHGRFVLGHIAGDDPGRLRPVRRRGGDAGRPEPGAVANAAATGVAAATPAAGAPVAKITLPEGSECPYSGQGATLTFDGKKPASEGATGALFSRP